MDRTTQHSIALGMKSGDRNAWLALYNSYSEQIWRNVSRLINDHSAIGDIVQETFLAAARSSRNYDQRRGSLWVWLWTIARRQIALYYRKQKPAVSLEHAVLWWQSLDGQQTELLDHMAAPAALLEQKELAELVRRTLCRIPAEYETLLLAKYVDQSPAKTIAEQLNCSVEAVRSKLARAKKAFKKEFLRLIQGVPVSGSKDHENE